MQVLLWEHFCSGAVPCTEATLSIRREGTAMLTAVAADLVAAGVQTHVLWSAELGQWPVPGCLHHHATPGTFPETLRNLLANGFQCLAIAPECDGTLLEYHRIVEDSPSIWRGAGERALRTCGDKLLTFHAFEAAGVPVVPTRLLTDATPSDWFPVVVKPRDGAGCENTVCVLDQTALQDHRAACAVPEQFIQQPWIAGQPMSVAVICRANGPITLPAVVQNIVTAPGGSLTYAGGTLQPGLLLDVLNKTTIAGVLDAVQADRGWYGIDWILTERGDAIVVEVNPRLTTSYTGYRRATHSNLAAMLIGNHNGREIQWQRGSIDFDSEGICSQP